MRRDLLKSGLAVAVGSTLSGLGLNAIAQDNGPQEGKHYRRVTPTVAVAIPGKIEVVEFFWFGCQHCYSLEPAMQEWVKKLPADVVFRKEHVAFPQAIKHQQLFYTLRALGVESNTTSKVFEAIHKERKLLLTATEQAEFAEKLGIDKKKYTDTLASFTVQTVLKKSSNLSDAYKVDSVPVLTINGKYYTGPAMAGNNGAALEVADILIKKERALKS